MRYTSNYNFAIAEGTDNVNLLTQSYPNFETIDTALKEVSDSAITGAAETKVGTVHNLVRTSPDRTMIKFTATSNFATGDTFTVDGVAVTAVTTGGTALKTGAFLINSNVLCILNGLVLTVLVSEVSVDASDVSFDNIGTSILSNNVQDAIEEVKNAIPTVPSSYAATAITYDNSGSGLTATNAQDAIDEIVSIVSPGGVSRTSDGTSTYTNFIPALLAAADLSKITYDSKLVQTNAAGKSYILRINKLASGDEYVFSNPYGSASSTLVSTVRTLATPGSGHYYSATITNTPSYATLDTTVVPNGEKWELIY